jgi:hypothetical protein
MGNCAGYCTGCKEDYSGRQGTDQMRNSYKSEGMID